MKIIKLILITLFLYFALNCSSDEDKKEKQCEKDRKILQICLLINQNDDRFCETQSGILYYNCGAIR
ncbi:hypothetical protein [Leptospira meyeri]|uniref:hypothetical protein n=1 Tax=Leptospira meyeri TaxID=29508 RepID=UPI000F62F262|nr:hypothetical protein [Leptospira meyeri]TGM60097.1 hypothetical protein EHQ93_17960 [Leptospira meyeri]